MSKIRVGIDPGKEGFIVWFDGNELGRAEIPLIKREVDTLALDKIFKSLQKKSDDLFVIMEATNAFFGASSKTMYKFGHTIGCTEQAIVSNGIPFTKIRPVKWQKEMFQGVPKQYVKKKGNKNRTHDTKATALIAAKRLFPDTDLRKNSRCRTPHDGFVDSLLIAEFCRRNY